MRSENRMDQNDLKKLTDGLDDIKKAILSLSPNAKSGRTSGPTLNGHTVGMLMPVEFDWMKPSLRGHARAVRTEDGVLTITIHVTDEDADIVEDLIDSQPVTALRLTSVEPR